MSRRIILCRRTRFVSSVRVFCLLILLAWVPPTVAATSNIRACELWKSQAPTDVEKASAWLKDFVLGLFMLNADGSSPASTGSEPELYFTNTSDFSSMPKCSDDLQGRPSRRDHLYYPIGLVVRKIGEVDLRGKYWLVETEYGLKTFIRERHLTPLEKDHVYLFANTKKAQKAYCLGQDDRPCTPDRYLTNRHLDPQTRYAVADMKDFERQGGRSYILPKSDLPCGDTRVGIYGGDGRLESGTLNTCVDAGVRTEIGGQAIDKPSPIFDPMLKVVIWDDYKAYFNKKIEATLLRFEAGAVEKAVERIAPEFGSEKRCNQTLTFTSESEYQVEGRVGLKLPIVEIGGEAAKKYLKSYEEVLDPEVAIYLQAYDLKTELKEANADAALIQILYGCDKRSAPQDALEIRISHPPSGSDGDFVVGIKSTETGEDTADVLAITSEGKSGIFNQGYAFSVAGADDYFSIRDKLSGILRRQYRSKIQDFYDDPDDELYFSRATDFLVHLVIAAAGQPQTQP